MKFDVPSVVINKLFEQGYEEQIVDIVMAFENSDKEVSDIPLSPELMSDSEEEVIVSPTVYKKYLDLVTRIRNSNTAQEIPFFLLGNRKIVDGSSCIVIDDMKFDIENGLSESRVSIDTNQFQQLISEDSHSIISIGHTHGNVSEEKKNSTLARMIPDDIKGKYSIRDTGLNISIADIWQHEAFKQIAAQLGKKEILQTIIMYNGDIVMMGANGISKSNNIATILDNGETILLPTASSNEMVNKNTR